VRVSTEARDLGARDRLESRPVSVAHGYERWAPTYDGSHNPLLAREQRYLLPVLAGIRNRRLLDLACGTGRWLEQLSSAQAGATGVDHSSAMLRIAHKKPCIAGKIVQADCANLPFRAGIFDLAIFSFALGHMKRLDTVVRELARVTTSGGEIFVSDLHPEAYAHGWRVGFRDDREAVEIEMFPRTSLELLETFVAAGFQCISRDPLWLEEPERPIFNKAGRSDSFMNAISIPAVLVFRFKKAAQPMTHETLREWG
jgi:ubiquinone/menaquinone biosynthesis C-methylase UbiE